MKGIPLIRASGVLPFASFLAETGAPLERLWIKAGMSPRALHDPDGFVPLHLANRFVEEAAASAGVDDFGLVVARRFGFESLGTFGAGIRQSATLFHAVAMARDTVVSHNSAARYWIVMEGDSVRLCRRWRAPDDRFRQTDLFTVAMMVDLVRAVAGPAWRPRRVDLQSGGSCDFRGAEMLSDACIQQKQPATSISFPRALLSRPLVDLEPSARATSAASRSAWLRSAPPTDLLASVGVVIQSLLEAGRSDLGTAARAAGMSARSFQRGLSEQGLSFSQLVDRTRFARATQLLEDGSVKIIDIAFELGYSDPAHFTRAFRRWTSVTPLEYRERHAMEREGARRSA